MILLNLIRKDGHRRVGFLHFSWEFMLELFVVN